MTITFHFLWPDGVRAAAQITAEHPNDEAAVLIHGQRDRLATLPASTRTTVLQLDAVRIAAETHARLDVEFGGQWPGENDVR